MSKAIKACRDAKYAHDRAQREARAFQVDYEVATWEVASTEAELDRCLRELSSEERKIVEDAWEEEARLEEEGL